MHLLGGEIGGGPRARLNAIPIESVGKIAHADRLARSEDVLVTQEGAQFLKRRRNGISIRGHRGGAQALLIRASDSGGEMDKRLEHRTGQRIGDNEALRLRRHVSQRDLWRRDPRGEPALEQGDRLVHEHGEGAQPGDDVFILLHRTGGHLRNDRWDVLLHAAKLIDRHQLAREAAFVQRIDGIVTEEVVVELVVGAELGAIDGAQCRQRIVQLPFAPGDRLERVIGPARVLARISHGRRLLGILVHPVCPVLGEELVQADAVRGRHRLLRKRRSRAEKSHGQQGTERRTQRHARTPCDRKGWVRSYPRL